MRAAAPAPRHCSRCGKTYARRNLIEVWSTRNPGSRLGWAKTRAAICLRCQDARMTGRVIALAEIRPVRPLLIQIKPRTKSA